MERQGGRRESTNKELKERGFRLAAFCVGSLDFLRLIQSSAGEAEASTCVEAPRIWHSPEETGVPALRNWLAWRRLRQLGYAGESVVRAFLTILDATVAVTAPADGQPEALCDADAIRSMVQEASESLLERLTNAIECSEVAVAAKLRAAGGLRQRLCEGQKEAADAAPMAISPWCRPSGSGGLHWATFRATVRRQGNFREDWNEVLATPMLRRISAAWDRFFSLEVGTQLDKLKDELSRALEDCLQGFGQKLQQEFPPVAERYGATQAALRNKAKAVITQGITEARSKVQESQKDISRDITPRVQTAMSQSYLEASQQHGTGTDVRQKALVQDFIDGGSRSGTLFAGIVDALLATLETITQDLGKSLRNIAPMVTRTLEGMLEPVLEAQKSAASRAALAEHLHPMLLSTQRKLQGLEQLMEPGEQPWKLPWSSSCDVADEGDADEDDEAPEALEESEDEDELGEFSGSLRYAATHKLLANQASVGSDCQICQETLRARQMVARLPCLHLFHARCIGQWLGNKKWCPVCRHDCRKTGSKQIEDSVGDPSPAESEEEGGEEELAEDDVLAENIFGSESEESGDEDLFGDDD